MFRSTASRIRAGRRSDAGFTLIELLIVIVILGILAAIVAFSVRGITNRGAVSACKAEVKTVATAQEAYYAQSPAPGDYADNLTELSDGGFLRSNVTEYVASVADDGSMAMKGGAPCAAA